MKQFSGCDSYVRFRNGSALASQSLWSYFTVPYTTRGVERGVLRNRDLEKFLKAGHICYRDTSEVLYLQIKEGQLLLIYQKIANRCSQFNLHRHHYFYLLPLSLTSWIVLIFKIYIIIFIINEIILISSPSPSLLSKSAHFKRWSLHSPIPWWLQGWSSQTYKPSEIICLILPSEIICLILYFIRKPIEAPRLCLLPSSKCFRLQGRRKIVQRECHTVSSPGYFPDWHVDIVVVFY